MVRFSVKGLIAHQLSHFLTFADAGKDNGEQDMTTSGSARYNAGIIDPGTEEENPVFNENMDLAGSRFRLASHIDFGIVVAGAMTF